jgi:serine/threonine protein kinase
MPMTCSLCRANFPAQALFCPACGTPVTTAGPTRPEAIAPGVVLCDRFRVVQRVGVEGTGVVWLAQDTTADTEVVLKVLPRLVTDHTPTFNQLLAEADNWKRLDHPNIVRLHQLILEPLPFLVVENVPGDTSRSVLAARGDAEGQALGVFSPKEVLEFLERLADALDHAHEAGVLHQDIKPANVLLTSTPQGWIARLTNFGVSALIRDRAIQVSGQFSGGVPAYMAPEQVLENQASSRSDIYALGSVLFHLLTGLHPPFAAGDAPPTIPPDALAVLVRAMSQNPAERPGTATALYTELRSSLGAAPELEPAELEPRRPLRVTMKVLAQPLDIADSGAEPTVPGAVLPFPVHVDEKPQPQLAPELDDAIRNKEELYPRVCDYHVSYTPRPTPGAQLRLLAVYLRWGLLLAFIAILLYGLFGTPTR